jgi:hypothetical protein
MLSLAAADPALCQYRLAGWTMNSGGTTMGSGGYRHGGSVGTLAVDRMSGGAFAATSGFWNHSYGPVSGMGEQATPALPLASSLWQNSPNPIRESSTDIHFAIGAPEKSGRLGAVSSCHLTVHDVQGRLVRTLLAAPLPPGPHAVRWDCLDERGLPVATGVYFYTLQTPLRRITKQLVIVR